MLAWYYKPMGEFSLFVYNQKSKRQKNNSEKFYIASYYGSEITKEKYTSKYNKAPTKVSSKDGTNSLSLCCVLSCFLRDRFLNRTGFELVITLTQFPPCRNCFSILI